MKHQHLPSYIFGALLLSSNAYAELEITQTSASSCSINIRGEITLSDAERLEDSGCGTAMIWIEDSPGGDVQAGIRIGQWARVTEAFTVVNRDQYCYSSCALIFIGGVERINLGSIGLHRPYLAGSPQPENQIPLLVTEMFDGIRAYVERMNIRPEFANVMLNTLPEKMSIYHGSEIYELVSETDAIFDEIEASRKATSYGISTDEYRLRDQEAKSSCDINFFANVTSSTPPALLWERCQQAIYWGLSQTVYQRRLDTVETTCESLLPLDLSGFGTPLSSSENENTRSPSVEYQSCRIAIMQGLEWPKQE